MALTALKLPQLTSPEMWIQWYNMIKTTAIDNDVWQYCDPDGTNGPERPTETSASASNAQGRVYTTQMTNYHYIRKGIAAVTTTIQGTILEDYQAYLEDTYNPRDQLKHLRTAIKPSLR
jgi:hypothetical protein